MPDSSAVVFIAFGVLSLCVVLALCVFALDWFSPLWRFLVRAFKRFNIARRLTSNNAYDSDFDSDLDSNLNSNLNSGRESENLADLDDLSSDASQVLAMLNMPTVVIDSENDVIRASSEAYLLGVVIDDSLCQPRVLQAVNSVRASGGFERLSLVTSTPERYKICLLYTSPSPRDKRQSRMPSSA